MDLQPLLNPIPGPNPSGENLRYAPVYDKVKEARREDDDVPLGDWQTTLKKADWALVVKLCSDVLTNKTKDLQLAAWLTEALIKREGFSGLLQGLELLKAYLENFWDTLYPEIEDDDAEMRAMPLEWVGLRLEQQLKSVPLTKSGLDWFRYKESRAVGYEADAEGNDAKAEARRQAIEDHKVTGEDWDKSFDTTPKAFYVQKAEVIENIFATLESLREVCDAKFGNATPSFSTLQDTLEELKTTVRVLLQKKRETEPDEDQPQEAAGEEPAAETYAEADSGGAAAAPARARIKQPGAISAEPSDAEDALQRIYAVARWMRAQDSTNPVPFLLLRAIRFAELRTLGSTIDSGVLDGPSTETRKSLRALAAEGNWQEVLNAAEIAMEHPSARGWLDLQRYAVTACENLGMEAAAAAIRAEIKVVLADYPGLPSVSFNDETPVANADTQSWVTSLLPPPPPEPAAEQVSSAFADMPAEEPAAVEPDRAAPATNPLRLLDG